MDMRMPELDGVAACTRILSAAPEGARPRVLALTSFDIDEYVYAALRAGLGLSPQGHRTRTAVACPAPGRRRRLPLRAQCDPAAGGDVHPGERAGDEPLTDLDQLTPRELEILRLVATGACNEDIAALLTVSGATVKSHLSRAMTKLGLCSRAQAVVMAYESGLVVPRRCRAEH